MSPAKILFVDDEPNVTSACRRVMRREAFEIVTFNVPEEALEALKNDEFAVIVSDQRMPGMEGTALMERAREIQPDAVRIILTGYADIAAAMDAINKGNVFRFLNKPWQDEELRAAIITGIQHYEVVQENRRLTCLTREQNEALKEMNASLEQRVAERTQRVEELNRDLEGSLCGTVEVLAHLTELHSTVVGAHSKRVADIAGELARRLELSETEVRDIYYAGLLHDVGKVALPLQILTCPDRQLTPSQRDLLRHHVDHGEAIVSMIPHMERVATYVRYHHENMNGTGYPDQLRGEAIPLGARIVSVANAWDRAMNSSGQFQTTTTAEALMTLEQQAPEIFDLRVVTALQAYLVATSGPMDREVDVKPSQLKAGMVLAEDLRSASGMLLMKCDTCLTEAALARLLAFSGGALAPSVKVYRQNSAPAELATT